MHPPRARPCAAVLLAFGLLLQAPGLCASAPAPLNSGPAIDPSRLWRQTSFLVGGWCVNDWQNEPRRLVALEQAGFDYIQNMDYGIDAAIGKSLVARLDSLRLSRPGFRLQAIVHDRAPESRRERFGQHLRPETDLPFIFRALEPGRGMNGSAVLGWCLWDEPHEDSEMAAISLLSREFRANPATARGIPFVNLLPVYASEATPGFARKFGTERRAAYRAYLDRYLHLYDGDPAPAPLLSFDHYPFQVDAHPRHDYLLNLSLASERARLFSRPGWRIPLWVIVQTSASRTAGEAFQRVPSVVRTRWQVWCALAYGARSISYWTLGPVYDASARAGWGPGILGWDRRPNSRFAAIRRINAQLHVLGPTLMELDLVQVFHVDLGDQVGLDNERIGSPDAVYRLVSGVGGPGARDCLIGYFKRAGRGDDYLLVVNKSLTRTRSFDIRLAVVADSLERIDSVTGKLTPVSQGGRRLSVKGLAAGTGVLFRLVTPVYEPIPGVEEIRRQGERVAYRTRKGWLSVDYATGARQWVAHAEGEPASDLFPTPSGVLRR